MGWLHLIDSYQSSVATKQTVCQRVCPCNVVVLQIRICATNTDRGHGNNVLKPIDSDSFLHYHEILSYVRIGSSNTHNGIILSVLTSTKFVRSADSLESSLIALCYSLNAYEALAWYTYLMIFVSKRR